MGGMCNVSNAAFAFAVDVVDIAVAFVLHRLPCKG
jgi:hypothetical protein